jgi:hypothetical protein
MKIMVCDKVHSAVVAQRQRGFIQNAQQQLPQRVAGFFDFVKQQKRNLQFFGVILRERFLSNQRMRLAVPQISRRRTNQFRDFVGVLELGAVHFNYRARIAEQHFGRSFHHPRLARAGGTEEQQVPHRTPRRIQARAKDLIQVDNRLYRFILPHNLASQPRFKIPGFHAAEFGIQLPTC